MTVALSQNKTLDRYLTLSEISWSQLEQLETILETVEGVKLIYLDGILEIMAPSPDREEYKSTLSLLVEAHMREAKVRFYKKGSSTLGSEEKKVKKEPDESYSIGTKKEIPDLAIEIVLTSGGIDKLQLYQRLGVPEI
ncbi:MAG: Uma2 family endonuclease [Cyanobacteriota bacterium]|nr:Uma2 family endonuclease [Cyanobacteriota bacterium]